MHVNIITGIIGSSYSVVTIRFFNMHIINKKKTNAIVNGWKGVNQAVPSQTGKTSSLTMRGGSSKKYF